MKAAILNFSLRAGGNCEAIARCAQEALASAARFDRPGILPCGGCGYACFSDLPCPHRGDDAYRLYDAVCESDVAVYIVPNYCNYPNACFFAFSERGQAYFQGHDELYEAYMGRRKKFIVVSNTEQENFTRVFSGHIPPGNTPEILFLSARAYGKSSIDGDMMEAPAAREAVMRFVRQGFDLP